MVKLLGGGSNLNQVISDMNSNLLEQKGNEVRTIFKDDQGTRVVMLDKDGLKTTAPGGGVDVFTADNDEFTFNSNQNVFKIAQTASVQVNVQATIATPGAGNYASDTGYLKTISHGLGYTPAVVAYLEFSSGLQTPLPYDAFSAPSSSTAVWTSFYVVVNSTTVALGYNRTVYGVGSLTFAIPFAFRYYLLQETAT